CIIYFSLIGFSQEKTAINLNNLAEEYYNQNNFDSAFIIAGQAQLLAKDEVNAFEESRALFLYGKIFLNRRNLDKALEYFQKSLEIRKNIGDKAGISKSLSYIGSVHQEERKYRLAMDYFNESIKYREQIGDKKGVITMISKIGTVYFYLEDLVKAESHYREALVLAEKQDYSAAISASYNMLGLINMKLSDDADTIFKNKALMYYQQGLNFAEKQNNYREFVNCSNNIGSLFMDYFYFFDRQLKHEKDSLERKRLNNLINYYLDKSLQQYELSMKFALDNNDLSTVSSAYLSFGTVYLLKKQLDSAFINLKKSEMVAIELDSPEKMVLAWLYLGKYYSDKGILDSAKYYSEKSYQLLDVVNRAEIKEWLLKQFSEIYEKDADYRISLNFYKKYSEFRDSLLLDQKAKLVEIQKYDFEKMLSDRDERLKIEQERGELNTQNYRLTIILLLTGLFGVLLFLGTLYRQNRKRARLNSKLIAQKDELDIKNAMLSEKNDEINESIEYARRIQSSTLPDPKTLSIAFPENFVFFRPRDVVSGDFYWWGRVEDTFVVTAADCTGHGVPGAFMSIMGMSNLKEIVIKEYITHPGVILRRMRKEVINSLKQKGVSGEQQDGMDMALVSYNFKTRLLQFSGAHNPLLVFSKQQPVVLSEDVEYKATISKMHAYTMFEFKADKMPVGIFPVMDRYKTIEMELSPGSIIVMYTDGYQDQFGGVLPEGKKFMAGKFKKMLHDNINKPFSEQYDNVETVFNNWKGRQNQVDDITVLALRV
ncbi:MAG: tetratricopeptide repeat protein, partial [Bacteroidales bacterium]|nr:tetratricopeptide repeat protein [Bacteroidales bacterium]